MTIPMRPALAGLEPYDPDMRQVDVMLSANEAPWNPPEAVLADFRHRVATMGVNRYPEATSPELRAALGAMWDRDPDGFVVANGGDELLYNLLVAFGGPGRALVNCPPTFSAYALYAQLTDTQVVDVRRAQGRWDIDADALIAQVREMPAGLEAAVVVITSPNNPTGNLTSPELVERLATATDAVILVDEAYGEFAPASASCVGLIDRYPNVCVLRTLSKAYALAGARVGYLMGSREVVDALLSVRLPYSVSRLDQAMACACVTHLDAYDPQRRELLGERAWLGAALELVADEYNLAASRKARAAGEQLPDERLMRVYPTSANFILVRVPSDDPSCLTAHQMHEALAARHSILVRDFSSTPGLAGCLRINVGTSVEDEKLIDALRAELGLPATWEQPEGFVDGFNLKRVIDRAAWKVG